MIEVIAVWLMTMLAVDSEIQTVRTDGQVLETEVSVLETELHTVVHLYRTELSSGYRPQSLDFDTP